MGPAAEQLKSLLVNGQLGWTDGDVTMLAGEAATKEALEREWWNWGC